MGKIVKYCAEPGCTRELIPRQSAKGMCKAHRAKVLHRLDPSKQATRAKKWYEKIKLEHPERFKQKARAYRKLNAAKVLQRGREYAAKNRAVLNERAKRRGRTLSGRWVHLKTKAKERKLSVTLTKDEYAQLILNPCSYCKGVLPIAGIGLDRLDNDRGYEPDNVVPCCTACNRMRGDHLTVAETHVAIAAVLEFRARNKAK